MRVRTKVGLSVYVGDAPRLVVVVMQNAPSPGGDFLLLIFGPFFGHSKTALGEGGLKENCSLLMLRLFETSSHVGCLVRYLKRVHILQNGRTHFAEKPFGCRLKTNRHNRRPIVQNVHFFSRCHQAPYIARSIKRAIGSKRPRLQASARSICFFFELLGQLDI